MISVIIPTYNRPRELERALESLDNQNFAKENFEVLVINDGGQKNPELATKKFNQKLKIKLFEEKHINVCHARNVGIKNAQGNVIAFFDDDAVASNNWLQNIEQVMNQEDAVVGRGLPLTPNMWQYFAPHYDRGDKAIEIETIWECNFCVKKEVLDTIGMFNEEIGWGHEGHELAQRINKKYQIKYYPNILIYHDYANGIINYFIKQKKFGAKEAWLRARGLKRAKEQKGVNKKLEKLFWPQKILIKIVARIGSWFYTYGYIKK